MILSDAELASISATVQTALDANLPLERNTPTKDSTGHSVEHWAGSGTVAVNIIHPSATQLQLYAAKIGSQRALLIRAMQTTDIQQGDHLLYDGVYWLVQNVQNASSYTVTKEYLITTIAK